MFFDPRPVSKETDSGLRISPLTNHTFCAEQSSCLLGFSEIIPCSRELPILFAHIENSLAPVVLLSTADGENAAVRNGQWKFRYIPAAFRAYPFLLMQTDEKGEQFSVALERSSDLISDSPEQGNPLFENDAPAPLLQNAVKFLQEMHADQQRAQVWANMINQKSLLAPFAITSTRGEEQETIPMEGLYFVNEKALNDLPAEDFLDLKAKGVLPALYAHLMSLGTINNIAVASPKQN